MDAFLRGLTRSGETDVTTGSAGTRRAFWRVGSRQALVRPCRRVSNASYLQTLARGSGASVPGAARGGP